MTAAWPGSVNLVAIRPSYTETPDRNISSFTPDVGPPLERRRSSVSSDTITFDGRYTQAEWVALKAFYRDDLKDGVLPFTRTHPLTGSSATFKFIQAPKITSVKVLKRIVSHVLRVMP